MLRVVFLVRIISAKKFSKTFLCSYKDVEAFSSNVNRFFLPVVRGGSRIFSRGGADFQKIFENFDDLFFFRSIRLIFRALPKR